MVQDAGTQGSTVQQTFAAASEGSPDDNEFIHDQLLALSPGTDVRVHENRRFGNRSGEPGARDQFDDLAINLAVEFKMPAKIR